MPAGHAIPLRSSESTLKARASSPYHIFFNIYKPSTAFKKSAPPPPDFHLVVIKYAFSFIKYTVLNPPDLAFSADEPPPCQPYMSSQTYFKSSLKLPRPSRGNGARRLVPRSHQPHHRQSFFLQSNPRSSANYSHGRSRLHHLPQRHENPIRSSL